MADGAWLEHGPTVPVPPYLNGEPVVAAVPVRGAVTNWAVITLGRGNLYRVGAVHWNGRSYRPVGEWVGDLTFSAALDMALADAEGPGH